MIALSYAISKMIVDDANSFTYVFTNQWGTLEQKCKVIKNIGLQLREGALFIQKVKIPIVIVAVLVVS
jgi:anthranilate/para-aminobenzoate synthase component II